MTPRVLLDRQLARLSGIDSIRIRYRRFTDEHGERIDQAMRTLEPLAGRLAFLRPPFDLANVAASPTLSCRPAGAITFQRIPPPGYGTIARRQRDDGSYANSPSRGRRARAVGRWANKGKRGNSSYVATA